MTQSREFEQQAASQAEALRRNNYAAQKHRDQGVDRSEQLNDERVRLAQQQQQQEYLAAQQRMAAAQQQVAPTLQAPPAQRKKPLRENKEVTLADAAKTAAAARGESSPLSLPLSYAVQLWSVSAVFACVSV